MSSNYPINKHSEIAGVGNIQKPGNSTTITGDVTFLSDSFITGQSYIDKRW